MKKTIGIAVAACVVMVASGCSVFQKPIEKMNDSKMAFWNKDDIEEAPVNMVAIWSESVTLTAGQKPTRGFGGRLYFYNDKNQTVAVDGQLIVYAYDDDTSSETEEPTKKFVFSKEEFETHRSESDFGPSYSVWIPWDAVGGDQKAISLVPIFKTAAGKVLMGDHSRNLLPGRAEKLQEQTTTYELSQAKKRLPRSAVQQVSFDERAETGSTAWTEMGDRPLNQRFKIQSTSIPLTPSIREQLRNAPPIANDMIRQRTTTIQTEWERPEQQGNQASELGSDLDSNQNWYTDLPNPRSFDQLRPSHPVRARQVGQPIHAPRRWERNRSTSLFDPGTEPAHSNSPESGYYD